ncbi:cytosolic sulfotransferase 15-like [Neltuma alba]|uniref:cytosolic sulfotransferase 15-like n=1 Tax=Neltuma alba TaxID=207710 RepID=UPI0010A42465|nr:cytosolic sulfotransferase 15-like [Prosopis alba]
MGPFWTNMLSYWRASKDTTDRVLFLKYEDLQADINFYLKRIAEFLECPLNLEEQINGTIRNIIELCTFDKMKELEVNKTGKFVHKYENKDLFRKGKVGDWMNHFSSKMEEELSKVIEDKLAWLIDTVDPIDSTRLSWHPDQPRPFQEPPEEDDGLMINMEDYVIDDHFDLNLDGGEDGMENDEENELWG